jgi:hypothetical protein
MTDQNDPYAERKNFTFEQAEGAEPLPTQLKPKELSQRLRAALWRVVYDSLMQSRVRGDYAPHAALRAPWDALLRDMYSFRYHRFTFVNKADDLIQEVQHIFEHGSYLEVLGWLQWVLRDPNRPPGFDREIEMALRFGRAGYRLLDDSKTIVPFGSDAELETIKRALPIFDGVSRCPRSSSQRSRGTHCRSQCGKHP